MKKGDIIVLPFPYTDLSGSKNRPAFVLIDRELDVTVAFISTQLKWREETDVLLQPTLANGLKRESLLRLSKFATIEKELILGLIGRIEPELFREIDEKLVQVLQIDLKQ